jgi:hypothetical protein
MQLRVPRRMPPAGRRNARGAPEPSAEVKELALLLAKICGDADRKNGSNLLDELVAMVSHANKSGSSGILELRTLQQDPGSQRTAQAAAQAILDCARCDPSFVVQFICWLAKDQVRQFIHSPAAGTPGKPRDYPGRWPRLKLAIGRVGRWLGCSVVLAALPIVVSFLVLPKSSSMTTFLGHGDFAILASALAAASIGEVIEPGEPARGLRSFFIVTSIIVFTCTIILLAGIAGDFPRLSPSLDAIYSLILFGVAMLLGIWVWAATVELPEGPGGAGQSGASGSGEGEKP